MSGMDMDVGTWSLQRGSLAPWWSPEMYEIFGVDPTAFAPSLDSVRAMIEQPTRATLELQMENWWADAEPFTASYQIVRGDGARRTLEGFGWRETDTAGSPVRLHGTLFDSTDHEDDGRDQVLSLRDITPTRAGRRLLQASLQQVQTLSAQRGALLRDLAEAEERERLRLAADIHDDTIQALSAVALRLSCAAQHADELSGRDTLSEAEREVRDVSERLRRLMFELMPPGGGEDLRAALETYCAALFTGSPIRFAIEGNVEAGAERSLILYRLLQEVLRNALKHSRGTRVLISLATEGPEIVARVADDGIGSDGEHVVPTHAGLCIVRRRVAAAGGSASFGQGLDGCGSAIEFRLPITLAEER